VKGAPLSGVSQLGYLVFEVSDLPAWRRFGEHVLGLSVVDEHEAGFKLRMDGRPSRIQVVRGPADDLAVVGWEVAHADALARLVARLREAGTEVHEAEPALRRARGVAQLFCFRDPDGVPSELSCGPAYAEEPFASATVRSGFLAEELGLGHLVLACRDQQRSAEFYTSLLGFALSDRIRCDIQGYPVDVLFFHCNARHHSLALGAAYGKRVHHFMVQVNELDDVGLAFERARADGVRIAQTLGRHPNDRMVSFYALTPSGFQFEVGWGARLVDDATWQTTEYDHISEWGHTPPKQLLPREPKRPEKTP
jgi:2,3-dihydroxybiphenyl 1,2-dioxygenase